MPTLRVLQRTDHDGRTWVYAADDRSGRTPLFACLCLPVALDGDAPRETERPAHFDERLPAGDTRLRDAVMFGAPHDGGELVLLTTPTTSGNAHPVVLRTTSPVRPPRTGGGALWDRADPNPASDPEHPRSPGRADRVAATLTPTARPLRWGPGPVSRAGGLALAAGALAGIGYFAHSLATEGFGWDVLPLVGIFWWTGPAAALLNWRVTADSTGLWLTGAFTVRHVPWDRLRAARYTREGNVEMRLSDGGTWQLPGLDVPRIERRLNRRPSYVRMVEEVAALHAHAELRPAEPSRTRDHGLPLGPALVLLAVLAATALITML